MHVKGALSMISSTLNNKKQVIAKNRRAQPPPPLPLVPSLKSAPALIYAHNTQYALLKLLQSWQKEFDEKGMVATVLMDLPKA